MNSSIAEQSAHTTPAAEKILAHLAVGDAEQAVRELRALKDELYAAIPTRQRQSRGITWVVQCASQLLAAGCVTPQQMLSCAEILFENLASDDLLTGVPIFLTAEYGKTDFASVLEFFTRAADAKDWVVREFSAAAFRRLVTPCRQAALPWLKQTAQSVSPNLRRFVSETLRPVTEIQWLQREPETSLDILCLLFRESHPYPRTSVGNNLSDLARRNPELILEIVQELVASGDKNSQWIAYRACRNLIKKDPLRVMNLLGVKEYHYKDRIYTLEALQ